MERERIMLEVWVDLDPIPGAFHTKEKAELAIQYILNDRIPHYNPTVKVVDKK